MNDSTSYFDGKFEFKIYIVRLKFYQFIKYLEGFKLVFLKLRHSVKNIIEKHRTAVSYFYNLSYPRTGTKTKPCSLFINKPLHDNLGERC